MFVRWIVFISVCNTCLSTQVVKHNSSTVNSNVLNINRTLLDDLADIELNVLQLKHEIDSHNSSVATKEAASDSAQDSDDSEDELLDSICPENKNGISNEARIAAVDYHNKMRSRLAKGLQRDKRSIRAPQAANLLKMVYDCEIEANAQKWASMCLHHHTPQNLRRKLDIGENLAWIPGNRTDEQFLTFSSYLWWREVETIGIGNDTVFQMELLKSGVGHYTQMAWHRTFKLGCGMEQCDDRMFVVCQYNPRGNGPDGRLIYKTGEPCVDFQDCPKGSRCLPDEGLCEMPESTRRRRSMKKVSRQLKTTHWDRLLWPFS